MLLGESTGAVLAYAQAAFLDAQSEGRRHGSIRVLDPAIEPYLEEMLDRSPRFRALVAEIEESRFPVYLTTYDSSRRDAGGNVGETVFAHGPLQRVAYHATIYVGLGAFEDEFARLARTRSARADQIEAALASEVLATIGHEFAHVLPVATQDGQMGFVCADPATQTPETSCIMQWENMLRRDMDLPVDPVFGADAAEEVFDRLHPASAHVHAKKSIPVPIS